MKKSLKLIVATLAIGGLIGTIPTATAQANTTTTPKSLRGTWYDYTGSHQYAVTKITTHAVTRYTLNSAGHISGKKTISAGKSGHNKLHVQKLRQGYGGTVYLLNKGT